MEKDDELLNLLEKERKKNYDKTFFNVKLRRETGEKINKIQGYYKDDFDEKITKADVVDRALGLYISTVVNAKLDENDVIDKYLKNKNTTALVSKFYEQNNVMLHLLLGIFQNIGLQKIGEVGTPITDFVDDLSEDNESTKLLEYIQELVKTEEHSNKLKRG